MENNNMRIRKFYCKLMEINKLTFRTFYSNIDENLFLREYNTEVFRITSNKANYNRYATNIPNQINEYHDFIIRISIVLMVIVQDLYISLKDKETLKTISFEESEIFNTLKQCIRDNNYEDLMNNKKNIDFIIAPLFEMINASALRKVELFKSLSDEDIKLLESLNPFFKEEYDHYNISITKEFLIKHINIWKKKKDYESAIKMITEFLIKIFNVNIEEGMKIAYAITNDPEEQINILTYLNNNDFDSLAPIVRNIYENSLTEVNKLT